MKVKLASGHEVGAVQSTYPSRLAVCRIDTGMGKQVWGLFSVGGGVVRLVDVAVSLAEPAGYRSTLPARQL